MIAKMIVDAELGAALLRHQYVIFVDGGFARPIACVTKNRLFFSRTPLDIEIKQTQNGYKLRFLSLYKF